MAPSGRRLRRVSLTLTVILLASAQQGAVAAPETDAHASVRSHTEAAGEPLPVATVSGKWVSVRPAAGRLEMEGWNAPGTASHATGKLVFPGPRAAGTICITRRYLVQAPADAVAGHFTYTLSHRRGAALKTLWSMRAERLSSPVDVNYFVVSRYEGWIPRIRPGDALVWTFTSTLDVPARSYAERATVRLTSC